MKKFLTSLFVLSFLVMPTAVFAGDPPPGPEVTNPTSGIPETGTGSTTEE